MPEQSGAEWLAGALSTAGCSHVFVMQHNLFTTQIALQRSGVECVLAHTEKGAAYMADGYARAAGRPGIVITQGGPGATNVVAGLADAYQAHAPVVAFTRALPLSLRYRDAYQDVASDFSLVTAYSAEALETDQIPHVVAQAFRAATAGAARPAHLSILPGAERGRAELPEARLAEPTTRTPSRRPPPDGQAIEEAVALLREAERPVLVAGGGAMTSGAWDEVRLAAEALSLPVATSLSGKGLIDERHPLAVGVLGSYGRSCTRELVAAADLVLYVGVHAGSQLTHRWSAPPPSTPAIQIDIEASQLGKNHPVRLGLAADARTALAELAARGRDGGPPSGRQAWLDRVRAEVAAWRQRQAAHWSSDAVPLRPERVCRELGAALPGDAVVVCDTGYAATWAANFLEVEQAGPRFLRCEGSLGWALPASLGARCARPSAPVVCLTGDGGLWYHLSELETAARAGIAVVVVVLDNASLAFETHIADAHFDGAGRELTAYRPVDFAAVAVALGVPAERVESAADLPGAFARALAADTPVLLDVIVDPHASAPVAGGVHLP